MVFDTIANSLGVALRLNELIPDAEVSTVHFTIYEGTWRLVFVEPLGPSLRVVLRLWSQNRARIHFDLLLRRLSGEGPVKLTVTAKDELLEVKSFLFVILSDLLQFFFDLLLEKLHVKFFRLGDETFFSLVVFHKHFGVVLSNLFHITLALCNGRLSFGLSGSDFLVTLVVVGALERAQG